MVRREAAQQVGHFDEGYGKYFEDVDYCLRTARAGWRVMRLWEHDLSRRHERRLLARLQRTFAVRSRHPLQVGQRVPPVSN